MGDGLARTTRTGSPDHGCSRHSTLAERRTPSDGLYRIRPTGRQYRGLCVRSPIRTGVGHQCCTVRLGNLIAQGVVMHIEVGHTIGFPTVLNLPCTLLQIAVDCMIRLEDDVRNVEHRRYSRSSDWRKRSYRAEGAVASREYWHVAIRAAHVQLQMTSGKSFRTCL